MKRLLELLPLLAEVGVWIIRAEEPEVTGIETDRGKDMDTAEEMVVRPSGVVGVVSYMS